MVRMLECNNIVELSKELYQKEVVIYGTSSGAIQMYKYLMLNGVRVIAFTDSFVSEEGMFLGLPIITIHKLKDIAKDVNIVLGTKVIRNMRQIISKLNDAGFNNIFADNCLYTAGEYQVDKMKKSIEADKMQIDYVYQSLADDESKRVFMNLLYYRQTNDTRLLELSYEKNHPQYFPDPSSKIFLFSEDEVFVDAGAYDGNTTLEFIAQVRNKYKHIYVFEPDKLMFSIVNELFRVKKLKNVNVYQAGLYNENSEIGFFEDPHTGSSYITEIDNNKIQTVSLDELLYNEGINITYIKMDIEGAEAAALDGASRIIQRDHPKMAISIYHKESDLWELPNKILKEYKNYKIYIRHYTEITTETICYAIPY